MRIFFFTLTALISAGLFVNAQESFDDSLASLKGAVEKKDAAEVKDFAAKTWKAASKFTVAPAPGTTQSELDKEQVNQAKEAQSYAEYALYSTALASEGDVRVDLFAALEELAPASKYLNDGYSYYFAALTQTGGTAKIPAIAEKAIKSLPNSPDVLEELMNLAAQKNQNEKAGAYAQRLITALGKRPKSDVIPDAEWAKKKNAMIGRAHMINGLVLVAQEKNFRADQELRTALAMVTDDQAKAAVLFNLAMANYKLGSVGLNKQQILEAAKFSQQCAAITSQYQAQCSHNVSAMKTYAANMH